MHYIYHIPERNKIGVTINLAKRMKEHKWTGAYEVVEQHLDAQTAGDREWELQDQYGYPRDKFHYTKSLMNASAAGKKGGRISKPTITFEQRSAVAIATANTPKRIQQFKDAIIASHVKVTCPHCNKTGSKNVYYFKHFDNCQFNSNDLEKVTFNQNVLMYSRTNSILNTANTHNIGRGLVKKIINYFG